jgi:hypothetical protein
VTVGRPTHTRSCLSHAHATTATTNRRCTTASCARSASRSRGGGTTAARAAACSAPRARRGRCCCRRRPCLAAPPTRARWVRRAGRRRRRPAAPPPPRRRPPCSACATRATPGWLPARRPPPSALRCGARHPPPAPRPCGARRLPPAPRPCGGSRPPVACRRPRRRRPSSPPPSARPPPAVTARPSRKQGAWSTREPGRLGSTARCVGAISSSTRRTVNTSSYTGNCMDDTRWLTAVEVRQQHCKVMRESEPRWEETSTLREHQPQTSPVPGTVSSGATAAVNTTRRRMRPAAEHSTHTLPAPTTTHARPSDSVTARPRRRLLETSRAAMPCGTGPSC